MWLLLKNWWYGIENTVPEKPKTIIPAPRKGGLYGYTTKLSITDRRTVLVAAVKKCAKEENLSEREARNKIVKRLNVISIYNKDKNPKLSKMFREDMEYIQKKYPLNFK
jgi:hypothetical protein